MILHGIHFNLLIPCPNESGVYQDKAKWDIYKEINTVLMLEPNHNKNWQNSGARLSVKIDFINSPLNLWMNSGCSKLNLYSIPKIDVGTCTTI